MLKNENGFTLIEMLIVLTIITVLIILIIPNLANKSGQVHETGCEALQNTVQSQVGAYQLEKSTIPASLDVMVSDGFITDKQLTCQNGKALVLRNGNVSVE